MRVLVTTFPGMGHFHPLAPLALALKERGHAVLVATGPDLVGWVRQCGLEAAAVGLAQDEAVRRAKAAAPDGTFAPLMFTSIAPAAALTDLLPLARRLRPDLVVHEEAEFAGPVVAEVLGVPWVTHSWAAPAVPAATRDATAQRLELLWREHLATAPRCSGDLYLDACPPLLQVAEAGTIPGRTVVRPVPFEGPADVGSPALEELPRPAAYVGFGTVAEFCRADRLVEVASSVAGEVASVLVTSGPCSADELRVALPPHVVVRRYVPLRDALPKVDLVVSHGGAGTTVAALASGLPHLVLPQGAPSQSRNGAAVAAAGAGLMLDGGAQTSSAVRRASAQLLEEPRFAAAAAAAGTTLGALPAPDDVVDLLVARYA